MIRPELARALMHWREVFAAIATGAFGLWVASLGGLLLQPVGGAIALLGLGWAIIAFRRTRFSRPVEDRGVVEFDEGQIGYFGAGQGLGGYIALDDLTEIRLLTLRGRKHWRLKSREGGAIVIPVAAAGAVALYDAFATLPDVDMGALTVALEHDIPAQSLWIRPQPKSPVGA